MPKTNFTFKLPEIDNAVSSVSSANDYFKSWLRNVVSGCSGLFTGYSSVMIRLRNVIADKKFSKVQAEGGKPIDSIMNQKEEAETYSLKNGFFRLACGSPPVFKFDKDSAHLKDWLPSLQFTPYNEFQRQINASQATLYIENKFTIALMRYEFANVYWTVMDLYNIYLTARFFNKTVPETNVLLIDERPRNHLDNLYQVVYHSRQLHSYPNLTVFKDLVWMFSRAHGPILKKQKSIPLVREFRRDALASFALPSNHTRNCSALNILFIWRRNYVAHPRNPSGLVWRKIKNEDELVNATKVSFPSSTVQGVQLDSLPPKEQLAFISTTDILVGMHGAAYGFSLFLPSGSGAIEMFPQYVSANWHMEYLIKWAGVQYRTWKNKDKKLEDTKERYTTVPPKIVTDLIKSLTIDICKQ